MTTKFIPPRDPNEVRMGQIKAAISNVLDAHISGRGKETKIEKATDDIVTALRPLLKLAKKPDKGATVMTEAGSMGRKGPDNL